MTDENYEASFNKKYFLSFKTVEEYSEHFNNIKTLSCKKGLKYILNKNNLTLYYNYKNGKKDTSLFDKNICDYDIIYIENKVTVSSTILTFLKNHFNITPINIKSSDHENTYKLTRKKN